MDALLSVVTITYNHEPYIAKCIEGVLTQKVDFPIEFIIAEDCSTDRTRAICEEYALRYPNTIKLLLSDINIGALPNERRAISSARGKYIALCEGDDYWTDENKLQKQVNFLEKNDDYSVCFHNRLVEKSGEIVFNNDFEQFAKSDSEGFNLSHEIFYHNWVTYPFSMVFRKDSFNLGWYDEYEYFRDTHIIFHLLQKGKGFVFNFIGGVRTVHSDSMYYSMNSANAARVDMLVYRELFKKNIKTLEGLELKNEYMSRIQTYINVLKSSGRRRFELLRLALVLFGLNLSIKVLAKNLISICSYE